MCCVLFACRSPLGSIIYAVRARAFWFLYCGQHIALVTAGRSSITAGRSPIRVGRSPITVDPSPITAGHLVIADVLECWVWWRSGATVGGLGC